MIDRRCALGVAVIVGVLCAPLVIEGQPARVYRVGTLHPAASSGLAWLKLLHPMGYVEGQNLVVERRYAAGKPEPSVDT